MMLAREVTYALYGAWRLVRLDSAGLAFFDRSPAGFWRSLWVLAFNTPAGLILAGLYKPDLYARGGVLRVIVLQVLGDLVFFLVFAAIMQVVARVIGREERWLDFIVPYNWTQAPVMALLLALGGLHMGGVLPSALGALLIEAVLIGWYVFCGWLARTALGVPVLGAVAVALGDFVLTKLLSRVMDAVL
jgi:hypothetical protein